MKKSVQERTIEAYENNSRYLANSNEALERGDKIEADKLFLKSCSWLDRYNKLAGNS